MNKLFETFSKSSKEEWIQLLNKELKGANFDDSLLKKDEIEELTYPSFFHNEDINQKDEIPGNFPYKRGFLAEENDWSIVGEILVSDEKQANKKALDLLMKGNTSLHFEFQKAENIDLSSLFEGIEFQYITVYFTTNNNHLLNQLNTFFKDIPFKEIFFNLNPLAENTKLSAENLLDFQKGLIRNFNVDSYSMQQAGANCSQEIAFALNLGHDYLIQQIQLGRNVDDALVNLHFTFGVGSSYLFEIAKLRAFRLLWAKIARSYKPEHKCNETVQITSKIGFLNKSLQDPYTNLLRQTTEVMSAVLGGANHIINQAYDKDSTTGSSEIAERMATNISLILKEESYLEKVLDAVGGSYAIETLTENLADKAWKLFQEIEAKGNINSLIEEINNTASKRINLYQEKKKTLIGITKFPNPEKSDLTWKENKATHFGLKQIIIEKEILTTL
ncbi:MAG: methylmalonyl-CoA mutase family protein [Bacteroidota bacterium]